MFEVVVVMVIVIVVVKEEQIFIEQLLCIKHSCKHCLCLDYSLIFIVNSVYGAHFTDEEIEAQKFKDHITS